MLNDFFGHKIYTWNVENYKFLNLKNNIEFNQDLESYFSIASKKSSRPFESNGFAYSTSIENKHYHLFEELLTPNLWDGLTDLGIKNIENFHINRCWANRMHNGSSGKIHNHTDQLNRQVYTVVLYYNIPEQTSGDLVLLNPRKYQMKFFPNFSSISEFPLNQIHKNDKWNIKVSEGLCVLHSGDIPHAVSTHRNENPRDSIIIEFVYNN